MVVKLALLIFHEAHGPEPGVGVDRDNVKVVDDVDRCGSGMISGGGEGNGLR